MFLQGMKVIVQEDFTKQTIPWRERLLSWPWRPWVAYRWIENPVLEKGQTLKFHDTLVMRRSTFQLLQKHVTH